MIYVYNMNNNNYRRSQMVSSVLSIIFGLLISLLSAFAFDAMVSIIFSIIGFGIIMSNIIPLIMACQNVGRDSRYIVDIVFSIIAIVLGILFIFNHGMVLSIIFGVFLIIMPIVRIVMSNNKMLQLKSELPLFIAAILLFFNVADVVLRVALIVIGAALAILGIVNLVMELIYNSKHKDDFHDDDNDPFGDNGGKKSDDGVIIDAEVRDL